MTHEFWMSLCPPGTWAAGAINYQYETAFMLTPVFGIVLLICLRLALGRLKALFVVAGIAIIALLTSHAYNRTTKNYYCIGPESIEAMNSPEEGLKLYSWRDVSDVEQQCLVIDQRGGYSNANNMDLVLRDGTHLKLGPTNIQSAVLPGIRRVISKAQDLQINEILKAAPDCPLTPLVGRLAGGGGENR